MNFIVITVEEATLLAAAISSVVLPFIVSFIKQATWPDWAKFGLAAVVAAILGYLSLVSTGALEGVSSVIVFGSLILNVSSALYHTIFKSAGMEAKVNPESAATE